MDIQLLDTFMDLMETKSFNKTADRLGITQSTVSHRVRSLETLLGKKLFNRSRAGTMPTVAGGRFLDHARTLSQDWREAIRHVETARAFDRSMRLGMQHDVATGFAGPAAKHIRLNLPRVSLYLEVDYSTQIVRDLLAGELDIALVFTPQHLPDLHIEPLCSLNYRMISNKVTKLEDVTPEAYIFPNISPAFNNIHKQALPYLVDTPLACGQSRAIGELLETVEGSSYVSQSVADKIVSAQNGVIIQDAPTIEQPVYTAVNVRNSHVHSHLQVLSVFRSLLPGARKPQE